eukprot:3504989-Rhodomonas_salina.1
MNVQAQPDFIDGEDQFEVEDISIAHSAKGRLTEKWLRGEKSPPLPLLARRSSASQTNSP